MFGDDPTTGQTDNNNDSQDMSNPSTGLDNGFMPPATSDDTQVSSSAPLNPANLNDSFGMQGNDSTPNDSTSNFGAPASVNPIGQGQAHAASSQGHSAPQIDNSDSDTLLNIKQEALGSLTPLVGHLEQSPEEKFKTLMMMIQASDDHSKIKEAYEAANNINDDKERAQALLDVINEINYFTHQENSQS